MHDQILARTGGETGLLSLSILESAVERHRFGPFHGPGDTVERAAYLLRGIIQDHPFVDGNKRTGIDASLEFLRVNGIAVHVGIDRLVAFALQAAQGMPVEAMETWLRDGAQGINPRRAQEGR